MALPMVRIALDHLLPGGGPQALRHLRASASSVSTDSMSIIGRFSGNAAPRSSQSARSPPRRERGCDRDFTGARAPPRASARARGRSRRGAVASALRGFRRPASESGRLRQGAVASPGDDRRRPAARGRAVWRSSCWSAFGLPGGRFRRGRFRRQRSRTAGPPSVSPVRMFWASLPPATGQDHRLPLP